MKIFYIKDKNNRMIHKSLEQKKIILNYYIVYAENMNKITPSEKYRIYDLFINKFPKKASISKIKNRCRLSYRNRSNYRKLRLSRIMIKNLTYKGDLIGWRPANW